MALQLFFYLGTCFTSALPMIVSIQLVNIVLIWSHYSILNIAISKLHNDLLHFDCEECFSV